MLKEESGTSSVPSLRMRVILPRAVPPLLPHSTKSPVFKPLGSARSSVASSIVRSSAVSIAVGSMPLILPDSSISFLPPQSLLLLPLPHALTDVLLVG